MKISRMDHLVLTVRDVEAACRFYERVLGMEVTTFGEGRRALLFGAQKINLHEAGREAEPHALAPAPGSADLCFIVDADIDEVTAHLNRCGVEVIEGPVPRTGALGPIRSVYLRDPDGNLLELANPVLDEGE